MSDSPVGDLSPRKNAREIDSLRRERDSIKRILSQSNLDEMRSELEKLYISLDTLEREFGGI
ncbi:MAG: hypothetical protein L7R66_01790 [Candidatus Thalassarchaeaceae archaeon]|nr:hypothetical protein [Candidatus Thalassarchaeaceae archaeon]